MDAVGVLNPSGLILAAAGFIILAGAAGAVARLPGSLLSIWWMKRRSPFGRAAWASRDELKRNDMLRPGGLFLGWWRGWFGAADLYRHGDGHLLAVAGSGAGKTTGLVVPALLELRHGSVIVTDPKAQLAAMTARHRATIGKVFFINPWADDLAKSTGAKIADSGFNPLSVLEDNYNLKDDAENLARLLLVTDRQDSSTYWNDEAAALLAAFIVWQILMEPKENRTLSYLWEMLRDEVQSPDPTAITMKKRLRWFIDFGSTKYLQKEGEKYFSILNAAPQQWQGFIAKAQLATSRYAPKTPLGDHTARNGFDLDLLKREDVTVYLMVPTGRAKVAGPWLNLLMGVFGLAVGKPGPARPVFMLMDEAPALGYLPDLRNNLRESREAGLRTWIFTQTRAALADEALYGDNGFKDIIGLCDTKIFFSIGEADFAKDISAMLGEKTGVTRSRSETSDRMNASLVGVPLMRPEQILRMKRGETLIVRSGVSPIRARLVSYWTREKWQRMTDKNPYRNG